ADSQTAGHTRAVALGFLADALNGEERFAEAFDAYVGENEEFRKLHEPRFANQPRFKDTITEWKDGFAKTDAANWQSTPRSESDADAPRQHVFLLGFLRSGTTLLEQVLASHSDLVHLEERPTFAE